MLPPCPCEGEDTDVGDAAVATHIVAASHGDGDCKKHIGFPIGINVCMLREERSHWGGTSADIAYWHLIGGVPSRLSSNLTRALGKLLSPLYDVAEPDSWVNVLSIWWAKLMQSRLR